MKISTPVLLVTFNRPDTTRQVLAEILEAGTGELFVSADGPRKSKPDDFSRCEETRKLFQDLPSSVRLHTLFHDKNLGCRAAVSTAITWFFRHVERGIILEDDCLPDPSFFSFCEEGLRKYDSVERIKIIAGQNPLGIFESPTDAVLSKFAFIWGWASWRRVWAQYDLEISQWPSSEAERDISSWLSSKHATHYWFNHFNAIKNGLDTWDVQLNFLMYRSHGLAVIAKSNLVKNIGFLIDATHTADPNDPRQFIPVRSAPAKPVFPTRIEHNRAFDRELVRKHYFVEDLTLLGKAKNILRPAYRLLASLRK